MGGMSRVYEGWAMHCIVIPGDRCIGSRTLEIQGTLMAATWMICAAHTYDKTASYPHLIAVPPNYTPIIPRAAAAIFRQHRRSWSIPGGLAIKKVILKLHPTFLISVVESAGHRLG